MPQVAKLGRWEPHEAHQRKIQSPHLRSKNLMLQHIFRPPQMESHRKAPWHHGGHHVKHLPAIKPHVKKKPKSSWAALGKMLPAGRGRVFLLSTCGTIPEVLSPVLDFTAQERHGHTKVSLAKSHKDD